MNNWRDHARNGKSLILLYFDWRRAPKPLIACVRGSKFRLGSTNHQLAGPCGHNRISLISLYFDWRRAPGPLMACVGGSQFRLGSTNHRLAGPCPQRKIFDSVVFQMVTGPQAFHCMCRRIPISAGLDKLFARGTMPAQWKNCNYRSDNGPRAESAT